MRLLSLATAAGLMTTGLAVAAPAADAAGTCSLYVQTKFSIGTQLRPTIVTLGPNCQGPPVVSASWALQHPTRGRVQVIKFENGAGWAWFDVTDTLPLGKWTWQPLGAKDPQGGAVFQYTTHSEARLASYGRVVATRIGGKVNVKTTARQYNAYAHAFIGWAARGQIQWRTPGSATWHGLKDVYSSSTGAYSYTYTTSASREYRVVLTATSTVWGSTSPVVRR
jgi:hypothetical protein